MIVDVAIIGGGISGLTAALDLKRAGYNVVVLERQTTTGGNAISERFGGFLMEHGPTTISAMLPVAEDLSREVGLGGDIIGMGAGVRKRYLLDDGDLHGINVSPTGFLTSPYLSVAGRLSVLTEIFRRPGPADSEETVHAFTSRRFGREFADKVMDPLVAGIFAGDSTRLSVASVFPKLVEMETRHGSITRGIVKARRNREPGKRLFSYADGVGSLPAALARLLGENIHCKVAVKRIVNTARDLKIETSGAGTISARAAIIATQPHVAAGLLETLDKTGARCASEISAPALSVVFLGYRQEHIDHPLDSLGFLSVKGGNNILTGAQFCSTLFKGRAPRGHVSIAGYIGGARNTAAAQLPKTQLIGQVHAELTDLLGIKGQPVIERCRQWVRGLPQYETGHRRRKQVLLSTDSRTPGLFLCGNYLTGVSIANCIAQSRHTAKRVDSFLTASRQPVEETPARPNCGR